MVLKTHMFLEPLEVSVQIDLHQLGRLHAGQKRCRAGHLKRMVHRQLAQLNALPFAVLGRFRTHLPQLPIGRMPRLWATRFQRRQRFVQHNVQVGRELDVVDLHHIEVVEPEQLQASLDTLARLLRTVVEHPVVLALVTAHFRGHVGDLLQEGGPQLLQVRQMLAVADVQQRGERGIAVLMLQLTMLFCTCMYLPNSITWLVAATPYRSGWYVQCLFSSISMHVNPSVRILPQRLHLVHHQARGQLGDVAEKVNPLEERFQQRPLERIDIVQHQVGVDLLHRPIHIDRFVLILVALLIVQRVVDFLPPFGILRDGGTGMIDRNIAISIFVVIV
uniref:Uncharacterized protein n=1 Tax=Anopheles merus TaxID=30066 RepID=A0A182V6C3_ANOME